MHRIHQQARRRQALSALLTKNSGYKLLQPLHAASINLSAAVSVVCGTRTSTDKISSVGVRSGCQCAVFKCHAVRVHTDAWNAHLSNALDLHLKLETAHKTEPPSRPVNAETCNSGRETDRTVLVRSIAKHLTSSAVHYHYRRYVDVADLGVRQDATGQGGVGGGQGVDTWLIRDVAGIGDNFDRSHLSFVDDNGRRRLQRPMFRFPQSLCISTTRHATRRSNYKTNGQICSTG